MIGGRLRRASARSARGDGATGCAAPRSRAELRGARSYGDGDAMREALEGVATLFLVPAEESADRVTQHRTAVDAAVAAGVERIVYLSFLAAAPDATFTLARDHWATEEHIRAAGVAFTFARIRAPWNSALQISVQLPIDCSVHRRTGSPRHRIRRAPEKGGPHESDPLPALPATLVRRSRREPGKLPVLRRGARPRVAVATGCRAVQMTARQPQASSFGAAARPPRRLPGSVV